MSQEEIIQLITTTIEKDPMAKCFVTWICPRCKEEVTCGEVNTFYTRGFRHVEKEDSLNCGYLYRGNDYGLAIIQSVPQISVK